MKNKVLKTIVSWILFLALLITSTLAVDRLLRDKENCSKYDRFYAEKEDFDVLFFGSSRIIDGVVPLQLWEEYGIRSYNMAQHNENVITSYWQLRNAIKYHPPKVVFFDISLFSINVVTPESDKGLQAYLHKSLDHMPLSMLKVSAVNELTDGYDLNEYLFPLAIYHNRWSTLGEADIYVTANAFMGGEDRIVHEGQAYAEWGGDEVLSRDAFDPDMLHIGDVIELCRENDIDVVFTCAPAPGMRYQSYYYPAINSFEAYFEEKGVPFLNFCRDDTFLNNRTDYADSTHLNPSGSRKLTHEIGEYLTANYSFGEVSDKLRSEWDDAYDTYLLTRSAEILGCIGSGDVEGFLSLVSGTKEYGLKVVVPSEDYKIDKQIKNFLFDMGYFPDDFIVDPTSHNLMFRLVDRKNAMIVAELRCPY